MTDPFAIDGPALRLAARPYEVCDLPALLAALAAAPALTAVDLTGATLPRAVGLPLIDAIATHPAVTRVRVGDALAPELREALVAALCAKPRPRLAARPLPPEGGQSRVTLDALTETELAACERVLAALAADPSRGERHPRLRALAAKVARREERARDAPRRREKRERMRLARAARDQVRADATGLRASRRGDEVVESGAADAVIDRFEQPRACYVCHAAYRGVHFFYDRLCPTCAAFNWEKRGQTADLRGRVALVTGARVRIGYAVALKLLRAGATLVATSRFPRDAARRFAAERDFDDWRGRLTVHGLDLRDLAGVERFAARLTASLPRLDVLVNNAAQTVWRPPSYYAHLAPLETAPRDELPEAVRALLGEEAGRARALPGAGDAALVLAGSDDGTGHPIDLRAVNSWRLAPEDVETRELLETHAINTLAPYLLTVRLRGLMSRVTEVDRWVVQVSSPEGLFARDYRSGLHAHTNMAKASLNMFVRTASARWARERLWMCAVDTGWVSNQNPLPIAERMDALGFAPPLDETDAAARVCDPVFVGAATGRNVQGVYLKDYRPVAW